MAINNAQDHKDACLQFIESKGFQLDQEFIVDGSIHRFSKDGERNKKNEWYVAYEGISNKGNNYLVCTFGSWKTDEKYIYKSWDTNNDFENNYQAEFSEIYKAKKEETAKALELVYEEATKEAQKIWDESLNEAPTEEYLAYFTKKNISPIEVRFGLNPNGFPAGIISFCDIGGGIRTLQFISVDPVTGRVYKTFLAGGKKKENFATIRDDRPGNNKIIYVCEGYATGTSIYMSQQNIKHPVIVAGDAGNLSPVIENLRKGFRDSTVIICADDDEVGISKAKDAAKKYNCKVVIPVFPEDKSADENGKKYTDFNDLHCVVGLEEVYRQLNLPNEKTNTPSNEKGVNDPCADFSLDDYPELIAEYVRSICLTTEAEPIMVLSSVLATISAFMGKKCLIEDYFQPLYPNLWILIIAKSGQFKSTALNKGAKIAFRRNYEISKEIKVLQKNLEGDGIKDQIENLSLKNPILPTKVTAEGLLEILGYGRGGLILSNEFSGWIQNLEKKYNNDLKAILTDFYDVPHVFEYKTKTQGDVIIEKPFISICGVSPFVGIKSNLNLKDVSSGFFARFLIITPPHKKHIPRALPNKEVYYNKAVAEKLEEILLSLTEFEDDSMNYVLSKEAEDYFETVHSNIYKIHERYDEKCKEILEPFIKRWSPYILKVAMIMQLIEDNLSHTINISAIKAAWNFVSIAMKSTEKLYAGELGESETQRKCRIIYEWIKKKHLEMNAPVLRKNILSSRKLDGGSKEYDFVLDTLIDQGKIDLDNTSKKKSKWEYIPED